MQVRDHDRVDLRVVAEAAQLREHAVAAVEQDGRAVLLDAGSRCTRRPRPARTETCRAPSAATSSSPQLCVLTPNGNRLATTRVTVVTQAHSPRCRPPAMSLDFSEALLLLGALVAAAAALSGLVAGQRPERVGARRGGRGRAGRGRRGVGRQPGPTSVEHAIELALILTLFSDGLLVERELLGKHWGPPARALIIAMPVTMGLIALCASCCSRRSTGRSASCSARCWRRPTRSSRPRSSRRGACRRSCATRSTWSRASTTGSRCRSCSSSSCSRARTPTPSQRGARAARRGRGRRR